ncbi:hypothetical protein GCM10022222_01570 [Amycolatopsis ultiminotia]|uniref:Tyr recombinase domain-containing protein n=1 Tax=Amycolatopsis ultiminotia TaxID=543629 RepID=A0ABP6UXW4_9PSEU
MTDHNRSAEVAAAAKALLDTLGVSPEALANTGTTRPTMPTFTEYVPKALSNASPKSAQMWTVYLKVLTDEWPARYIDEPTATDITGLAKTVQLRSAQRNNSRGGHGARANFIDAVKFLYRCAVADRLISSADNPAHLLRKPPQRQSARRPLAPAQLADIAQAAANSGRDPALDALILRLHTETACRRGGALRLRRGDLDTTQLTIRLHEKGNTVRDQPISPTLMRALLTHADQRGGAQDPTGQLLRRRNQKPITEDHYYWMWRRIGARLPWVAALGVSSHWLRYTTLTWVERNFSYAVAAAYAGHSHTNARSGTTLTYVGATIEEVATALAALTGEPHPLATSTTVREQARTDRMPA